MFTTIFVHHSRSAPIELSLSAGLTLALVAVAAWTDARRHRIYNWTTYPGILLGIGCQSLERGWEGCEDALLGLLVCGGVMLFCFVFFPDLGGGDVKLIAMMGAGLGLFDGILAMLWTFVIGFVAGLAYLVWKEGAVRLAKRSMALIREALVMRGRVSHPAEEASPLSRWLFLGPAALVAVLIVTAEKVIV